MTQPQPAAITTANVAAALRPPKVVPAKHTTVRRSVAARAAHANKQQRGK